MRRNAAGQLAALVTIVVWGTTFISTKVLLTAFQPVEILFFRFLLGFAALFVASPHLLRVENRRREGVFALAGLCGVCLYYLMENVALTYTSASNVGVIISIAPIFTALLTHLFSRGTEPLRPRFFLGFAVAMAGICLISFNGTQFHFSPVGDLLAVLAALLWACYSVLSRTISTYGYPIVQTTRRTFFYGLLFMIPTLFLFDVQPDLSRLQNPVHLANLLFLGLGASALCFATWGFAVKQLGAVKTSAFIYLVPVITVVTSVLVLHEPVNPLTLLGTALSLAGLFLSERKAAAPRVRC